MNESVAKLSPEQLRRAADVAEQIESLRNELSNILGAGVGQTGYGGSRRQKHKISAAGIVRIRAAQKARRAKAKRTDAWATAKPKRRVSAAVKARLSAIAKARWKKAKAAGKTAL